MSAETMDVPFWPKVEAVVRPDGSAEVTIDGTLYPLRATDVTGARAAVLDLVRGQTAVPLGRPVRVDTSDPSGQWQLLVHPDGFVVDVRDVEARAADPLQPPIPQPVPGPPHPDPLQAGPPATEPLQAELLQAELLQAELPQPELLLDEPPRQLDDLLSSAAGSALPVQPAPAQQQHHQQPEQQPRQQPEQQSQRRSAAAAAGRAHETGNTPETRRRPTLTDLLADRPTTPTGPARSGWQGAVRRLTGGLVSPGPGADELTRRQAVATVQRSLDGPKTVVVVNPKGGAHKTTATLLIAATFGIHRGGYTLAWDNNETRGTLGWRATPARHHNTAVDLLRDLDRFTDIRSARVGDLDNYVRTQGSAQFDVLASDEDAASAARIDADAFSRLHQALSRFYRVMVIDTGNNMRASNWQAALDAADQLVIVSTVREDTAQSAAWLVDALEAVGREGVVERAVTVLSAPAKTADEALRSRLHKHFAQLTREVIDVPYDPALVPGGPIAYDALHPETRDAWLQVTAAVADGL